MRFNAAYVTLVLSRGAPKQRAVSWAVVWGSAGRVAASNTRDQQVTNSDIGKILSTNCTFEKTKIKKKRPGIAKLKKSCVIKSFTYR